MTKEIFVKPEIADSISKNVLRVIGQNDIDAKRTKELPAMGDLITISCYRGNGHTTHMFNATYKVWSVFLGKTYKLRKMPVRKKQ